MPRKKGRKSRSIPLSPHQPAAAQKPSEMLEAVEPRSWSPSHSPSRSQSLDQPPEQRQPESKEETEGPPPGTQVEPQEQPPPDAEKDESQEVTATPPRPVPAENDVRTPTSSVHRRPQGKRGKPLSDKRWAAVKERLDLLEKNLRPVPFAPGKAIDFIRHERLFRALGLWEFANSDIGGPVRADLLAQLIANYDPAGRRSWVNGARIALSRPDLARALGLPPRRERGSHSENKDADIELFSGEDSIPVITDFMSNWVLLHEEDACILPGEIMAAAQLVREGQPQKVDWCGLIWTMVEKELLEVPTSGVCYYASHLQCVMTHQKPGFFEGSEEQDAMEVPLAEEDDADVAGATSMGTLLNSGVPDTEKQGDGLCLALGGDGDILKDAVVECQENDQGQWLPGTKDADSEHYLRRCNLNDVQSMDSGDVGREEVGIGDEGQYVDDLTTKFSNVEGMTPTDLLQAMDNVPYCLPLQPMEPASGEFLVSRGDAVKSVELDTCMGGSSLFKMTGKREIDEVDEDDDGDNVPHFSNGNHQKRMCIDGQWDQAPLTFDKWMEEGQAWMGQAKMVFSQKDQEFVSAQMNINYLSDLLQQRENQIHFLEKTRLEDQHSRHMEICRFEHEIGVMARIVQGYRKVLTETRHAFAEYRKQFPQGDEQLYKDDDDGGGLVLTAKELDRKRLQKEEARHLAVQMFDDFNKKCLETFHDYEHQVHQLNKRLLDLIGEIDLLKERRAKIKASAEKE